MDELSSATSVTIGVNSFSERMLVGSLIHRKSITFAGPVYYTAGKVGPFLGTSGSLLIQNRGPCRSSGVVEETRNFVVRRNAEVPSLTDSTFPFSVDLGPCVGLKGFHGIERWGRWIDGTDGKISFRCSCDPSKGYEVRLRLMPFLVAPLVVSQTLEIKVNKHTVGTWVITKPEEHEISFMIPEDIEPGGAVVLELLVPTALSPRSVGGIDPRVLGIGVKEFRLQKAMATIEK